jgi:hypothetical protein
MGYLLFMHILETHVVFVLFAQSVNLAMRLPLEDATCI